MANSDLNIILDKTKNILKKEFFGIDHVIDDIIDLIIPWYKTPKLLRKPIIVCLWGPTGCGKTTLIRRISELLSRELVEIDVGSYMTNTWRDFGYSFVDKFYDAPTKNPIILLDEFHSSRTLNDKGESLDRPNVRSLWSLLSDGKITIDSEDYNFAAFFKVCRKLYAKGLIKKNENEIIEEDKKKSIDEIINESDSSAKTLSGNPIFIKITKLLGINSKEIYDNLENNFLETINNLEKIANERFPRGKQLVVDLCQSLIFISGNIDNVYIGDGEYGSQANFEYFYKYSLNISSNDIKNELLKIFRKEQVGRLGNNYIIYPMLNEEAYRDIIKTEINKVKDHYLKNQNISFVFDKSVEETLFREGVSAAQGARSILSIISSFLESNILKFIDLKEQDLKENDIVKVSFNKKRSSFIYNFLDSEIVCKVKLKDHKSVDKIFCDGSACVAIHEAGHVLISIVDCGTIPESAEAFLPKSGGITKYNFVSSENNVKTHDNTIFEIKGDLAGHGAESVFFGEENLSCGASRDIEQATRSLFNLIDNHGYGERILKKIKPHTYSTAFSTSIRSDKEEDFANETIAKLRKEVIQTIKEHKMFVLDVANQILKKAKINSKDIIKLMKKHNIKPKEKFSHASVFKKELKNLNKEFVKVPSSEIIPFEKLLDKSSDER